MHARFLPASKQRRSLFCVDRLCNRVGRARSGKAPILLNFSTFSEINIGTYYEYNECIVSCQVVRVQTYHNSSLLCVLSKENSPKQVGFRAQITRFFRKLSKIFVLSERI